MRFAGRPLTAGGFGAGVWWATAWMAGDRLAGSGLL